MLVWAIDELHRQTECGVFRSTFPQFDAFKMFQQRRAFVPRHRIRARDEVFATQGGKRNRLHLRDAELFRQGAVSGFDAREVFLRIPDEIHLVHRQQYALHAEQAQDVTVTQRLRQHAFAHIHQHDGDIRRGCAGGHVARVLRMAGAIGDDEAAFFRGEISIRHVDGDALLALGGKPVQQQRVIDLFTLRTEACAVALECGKLIFEHAADVVQQAADQRALAIVHAAAGDEA